MPRELSRSETARVAPLLDRVAEIVRRKSPDCRAAADVLPAYAAGDDEIDRATRAHIETCLRCQAEVARYKRLRRTLASLRAQTLEPSPEQLASIMSSLDKAAAGRGQQHKAAAAIVGVVAGATASSAAALWMWTERRKAGEKGRVLT